MNDNPLLSIIVPAYKVEQYLSTCVSSVSEQWQEGVELLLIDDGSPDGTPAVCDRLAEQHAYIQTFHKKNGGLSSARNFGIEKASGTYLLFLDGDDSLLPGALTNILARCRKGTSDLIVGSYMKKDVETGALTEEYQLDEAMLDGCTGEKLLQYLFSLREYCFYAWLYIVRREYILKNNLLFSQEHAYEDLLWTPSALYHAKTVEGIRTPFYSYLYKRKDSISTSFSVKSYYDKLYGCQSVSRFLHENHISREIAHTIKGKLNYIYSSLLFEAWRLEPRKRKEIWKELREYKDILKYSDRTVHRILYRATCLIGLSGVGYILHARWKLCQRKRER